MPLSRRDFLKTGLSVLIIGMAMPHALMASVSAIPVLMYHDISNDFSDDYTVSPAAFAAEMEWLHSNGYSAVFCSDLGKTPPPGKKHVVITFDDGYASFMDYAFPLMQQYNFKSTINIIGNRTGGYIHFHGNRPLLSWDEYRFLRAGGLTELGCHSYSLHRQGGVATAGESEFENDLEEFQRTIRAETGRNTDILAWPYGIYTARHVEIAKQAGFRYILTSNEGLYDNASSISAIPRLTINDKLDLASFQQYLGEPI